MEYENGMSNEERRFKIKEIKIYENLNNSQGGGLVYGSILALGLTAVLSVKLGTFPIDIVTIIKYIIGVCVGYVSASLVNIAKNTVRMDELKKEVWTEELEKEGKGRSR